MQILLLKKKTCKQIFRVLVENYPYGKFSKIHSAHGIVSFTIRLMTSFFFFFSDRYWVEPPTGFRPNENEVTRFDTNAMVIKAPKAEISNISSDDFLVRIHEIISMHWFRLLFVTGTRWNKCESCISKIYRTTFEYSVRRLFCPTSIYLILISIRYPDNG